MKIVIFSTLTTGIISGANVCERTSRSQRHRVAGRSMSKKNYGKIVGNEIC